MNCEKGKNEWESNRIIIIIITKIEMIATTIINLNDNDDKIRKIRIEKRRKTKKRKEVVLEEV